MLANDAVVDAEPVDVGLNVTVYVALDPAAIVTGNDSPLITNSEPTTFTPESMTLAVAAVSCPVAVALVPTATFPATATVVGTAVSVPPVAATDVPLSGIAKLGFDAFDVTVAVPVNVIADVGAKVTVNVVLCPAVNVTGGVIPEMVNPVPDAATAEIVALVPPVLVSVSV